MKKKKSKTTKAYLKKLERRAIKKAFKEWALAVKTADSLKCAICNRTDLLHAHHILPRELKEFRFSIHNGITLCPKHHKFDVIISPHKNPLAFFLWFKENRPTQFNYVCSLINKVKYNG